MKRTLRLPDYCGCCGAYLMGGATVHKPDCEFRKLIEKHFPARVEPAKTANR